MSHRRSSAFIGGLLLVACAAAAAQAASVADDRGRTVVLPRPAERIVTLAPSLAELAFAAGAGGRLVGVSRLSDFPPAAGDLPIVGDAIRLDFERIVALKPDLVLAWRSGNPASDVARLEQLGFPVYVSEARRLADIPRQLRAIGSLAGTAREAEKAAAAFERDIAALRSRHADGPRVRVFYEIWGKPLMTVSGAHLISDVISLCGGENVFSDVRQLTPVVSLEAVIAAKPEAILGGGSAGGEKGFLSSWREAGAPIGQLAAYYVRPDLIQQATPRIVAGAKAVCSALDDVRRNRR